MSIQLSTTAINLYSVSTRLISFWRRKSSLFKLSLDMESQCSSEKCFAAFAKLITA